MLTYICEFIIYFIRALRDAFSIKKKSYSVPYLLPISRHLFVYVPTFLRQKYSARNWVTLETHSSQLNAWNRVPFKKSLCGQLTNISDAFYAHRHFISMFTTVYRWTVSRISPIYFVIIHLNIILPSIPTDLSPLAFPIPKFCTHFSYLRVVLVTCPSNFILLDFITSAIFREH